MQLMPEVCMHVLLFICLFLEVKLLFFHLTEPLELFEIPLLHIVSTTLNCLYRQF